MSVTFLWSGGVSDVGGTVRAKISELTAPAVRIAYSTDPTLASPSYTAPVNADAQGYVQPAAITGLTHDTTYTYAVEIAGVLDPARGTFKTFPPAGQAASFTVVHGACTNTNSNHKVFTAIKNRAPLAFLHLGDFHYENIATNNQGLYRAAYQAQLAQANQAALYAALPIDLVWDDHDFGPDNADATAAGAPAAQAVYRQVVPSYPLPAADNAGIYHSFQIGRVWFIVTDLRSYRSVDTATDDATKTMLGATQKTWFKAQLSAAKAAGAPLIFWLSSSVWRVSKPYTGTITDDDQWGSFATERTEIANYVKANAIANLVILEGDAHMVAYDSTGSVSDFATGGGAPIPNYCCAAFEQSGNTRGTDWPSGQVPGDGHYAALTVTDDGTTASFTWQAFAVDPTTGAEYPLMSVPAPPSFPAYTVKQWSGAAWVPGNPKVWDSAAWQSRLARIH